MAGIFISYRRVGPDSSVARKLFQKLKADGHEVFMDLTMPTGADWGEEIEAALRNKDFLIALLSAEAIRSKMVRGEIEAADRLKKRILPVRVAYQDDLPYPWSSWINPLNWSVWNGPADDRKLLEELRGAIAGVARPVGAASAAAVVSPSGASLPSAPLSAMPFRAGKKKKAKVAGKKKVKVKAPGPSAARDPRYEERLHKLRKEIEERLSLVPDLATELVRKLKLKVDDSPEAAQVASAVVEAKGSEVARALNQLDGAFPRHRRIVREILWRVLPLVADWRSYVARVRSAAGTGPTRVELPLRTETIAALVMAGAHGRPMELDSSARGKGQVRLPAASYAAAFSSRQKLLETFLVVLKADGGPKAEIWANIQGQWQDPRELQNAVADQLGDFADPESPDCLPHYLLLVDHDIEERADPETYWNMMLEMGKKFPGLCLIRLKGGPDQHATEITVVNQVLAVLRRPE